MKKRYGFPDEALKNLYPFQSRNMEILGNRYHYIDEGSGEPIVMLHGNPTWSFYYRHLIRSFSERYRMIAPDHIGCGFSDKPSADNYSYTLSRRVDDFETFLSILSIHEKITLVLHDWGGMIGMTYAVRHPERIKRIILLNTAAFFPPRGKKLPLRLRLIRHFPVLSKPAVQGLNLFARGALLMAARKPIPGDVKRCLVAPYDSWNNRIATYHFVRDIPVFPSDPSYSVVDEVSRNLYRLREIPMLVCWGRHDFVFDLDYLEEWRQRFPEAETHLIDEAGHYILEDSPEKVETYMAGFLSRT